MLPGLEPVNTRTLDCYSDGFTTCTCDEVGSVEYLGEHFTQAVEIGSLVSPYQLLARAGQGRAVCPTL